jgi:hypothetical protein
MPRRGPEKPRFIAFFEIDLKLAGLTPYKKDGERKVAKWTCRHVHSRKGGALDGASRAPTDQAKGGERI